MNEGSLLQFVDTNILVYAYDITASDKHRRARQLVLDLWESGTGCLSIQVLQEFYVTATRKIARPLPAFQAAQIISDLSVWPTHSPKADDILAAIDIQQHYGIAFWDAMILISAMRMGCITLWSEDLNSGQTYEQVLVRTPF